jgi:hypothetical protein
LDERWGTGFLALAGFALGISAAIWHLLVMTKASNANTNKLRESTKTVHNPRDGHSPGSHSKDSGAP